MQRRTFLQGSLAAGVLLSTRGLRAAAGRAPAATQVTREHPLARLAALEAAHGGRLGVSILDTGTGRRVDHRGEERFPMCSTFKLLAAAAVLARVDRGELDLAERVRFAKEDIVFHSPGTGHRSGAPGMTLGEICEATLVLGDNTGANLMLDRIGGPAGWTAYVRSLGDEVSRLDRRETALNEAAPGDPRDTTTPSAMLRDLQAVLLGDALSPASRDRLVAWLEASRTGATRLRAGFPRDWRVGDRTGSSGGDTYNDIAIAWPPGRAPLLVTAYYTGSSADLPTADALIADVARIAATLG